MIQTEGEIFKSNYSLTIFSRYPDNVATITKTNKDGSLTIVGSITLHSKKETELWQKMIEFLNQNSIEE